MPSVTIDPGHGGYDPGAIGNGLQEKDITLAIAQQLTPLLAFNGISAAITRTGDHAPNHLENNLNSELNARVTISDNYGTDLFVSIHINSGGGTGAEVLVAGMGGKAEIAARKMLPYLVHTGGWANRGVKSQDVLVLNKTNAPAILTESGFIDSAIDSVKLKDTSFITSLSVAHARGICDYFGIVYKEQQQTTVIIPPMTTEDANTQAINLLNQAISILKG
jgi:N-acetylmuramoyl-L-alanine amidase